jgi:hypothetical protein
MKIWQFQSVVRNMHVQEVATHRGVRLAKFDGMGGKCAHDPYVSKTPVAIDVGVPCEQAPHTENKQGKKLELACRSSKDTFSRPFVLPSVRDSIAAFLPLHDDRRRAEHEHDACEADDQHVGCSLGPCGGNQLEMAQAGQQQHVGHAEDRSRDRHNPVQRVCDVDGDEHGQQHKETP